MLKTACGNGFPLNIPSVIPESGGSGGTSDYSELSNKPQINSVTLSGNKSAADLGLASADIEDLIPADASSSNQLATAADLPGPATTSAPGIVQPDGTSITILNGVISAAGGSGSAPVYIGTNKLNKSDLTAESSNNRHTGVSSVISQSAEMKALIDSSSLILCRLYIKTSDAVKTYLNSILLSPPGIEYNMYWADWKGFDYGIAAMSWASDKYSSYIIVKDGMYASLVSSDAIGVEYYKIA